ncbi:MAG: hypothetical protein JO249_07325 [Acidobacteria bacterium]|nr:hypothetical protein [Acidobacteriota bacterium]
MTLSDDDRKKIIDELDRAENAAREAILATFAAFVEWLFGTLREIYHRVKDGLERIWRIIRSIF